MNTSIRGGHVEATSAKTIFIGRSFGAVNLHAGTICYESLTEVYVAACFVHLQLPGLMISRVVLRFLCQHCSSLIGSRLLLHSKHEQGSSRHALHRFLLSLRRSAVVPPVTEPYNHRSCSSGQSTCRTSNSSQCSLCRPTLTVMARHN